MYEQINHNVSQCLAFSPEELEIFNALLKPKNAPKKTFLLKQGEICEFEAYIVKGCIKTYYIDSNGFEVILTFGIEDWWVSDITSFHEHKPSRMFIETLEDCQLLMLNPQSKEELLRKVPGFERVFRLMVQKHLNSYQERLFGSFAQSAQERYMAFLKKYPTLSQRISQHLIASYLGISPEFLSKIRSKMLHK